MGSASRPFQALTLAARTVMVAAVVIVGVALSIAGTSHADPTAATEREAPTIVPSPTPASPSTSTGAVPWDPLNGYLSEYR